MAAYAGEYTPEVTQNYLKSLQQPIQQQGAVDVGQARGEALRRGMAGDPFEALRVGAAQNTMNTNMANTNANLAFNVAGQAQQERVGKENLQSQQTFQDTEQQKQNAFATQQAAVQQQYALQLAKYQQKQQQNQFWPNLISNVVGYGAGAGIKALV
jgi:hypothetical protein